MAHYYIRYETFDNAQIAFELIPDEEKAHRAEDLDIPFYTVEQIVGADAVLHSRETLGFGARTWLAWIKATDEEVDRIKRLGGPFIQWLTEEEYNLQVEQQRPRF